MNRVNAIIHACAISAKAEILSMTIESLDLLCIDFDINEQQTEVFRLNRQAEAIAEELGRNDYDDQQDHEPFQSNSMLRDAWNWGNQYAYNRDCADFPEWDVDPDPI